MNTLRRKTVIGVFWSLTEKFGVTITKFIVGILLARLLTPEAFGLVGMIIVFFDIATAMVIGGFGEAYVQKKNIDKDVILEVLEGLR